MKPSSEPRFGKQRFPVVYVTRFGKHPCGRKICSDGKSPPKKTAQEDLHSCLSDKASATLHKTGPVGAAPQRQKKHPSLGFKMVQIQGSRTGHRQSQQRESQRRNMAKPPDREASQLAPSRKKGRGSKRRAANSTISGGFQESGANEYEFSTSEEIANKMEQKKKSAVWREVFEVISKMVEENGYFRNRLVSNFHFSVEDAAKNSQQPLTIQGTDINQNLQSEISFTETDEAIFGWV
ncbi:uncharacterized protein C5orf47 homolog [Erythrolamprus reginae]|uniref:uncharacterized protein C5orf47 homolog n=1 Tax=Erythrolamprus reginae TaxID=121349 RepID=UPI00396CE654